MGRRETTKRSFIKAWQPADNHRCTSFHFYEVLQSKLDPPPLDRLQTFHRSYRKPKVSSWCNTSHIFPIFVIVGSVGSGSVRMGERNANIAMHYHRASCSKRKRRQMQKLLEPMLSVSKSSWKSKWVQHFWSVGCYSCSILCHDFSGTS